MPKCYSKCLSRRQIINLFWDQKEKMKYLETNDSLRSKIQNYNNTAFSLWSYQGIHGLPKKKGFQKVFKRFSNFDWSWSGPVLDFANFSHLNYELFRKIFRSTFRSIFRSMIQFWSTFGAFLTQFWFICDKFWSVYSDMSRPFSKPCLCMKNLFFDPFSEYVFSKRILIILDHCLILTLIHSSFGSDLLLIH